MHSLVKNTFHYMAMKESDLLAVRYRTIDQFLAECAFGHASIVWAVLEYISIMHIYSVSFIKYFKY